MIFKKVDLAKVTDPYGNLHLDSLADYELDAIVSSPEFGSSLRETAKDILSNRREAKNELQKESLIRDTFLRLDRGLNLLESLARKPLKAAILTAIFAVLIAVSVNVLTALLLQLLSLK